MSEHNGSADQLAWELTCSPHVTSDILWNLHAYRAALYLLHCVQRDAASIGAREAVKDQLIRAAGAIGADLSEGYSRSTRADRIRYYGYALGSVRECIVWYLGLRDKLEETTLNDRLALVSRCRAMVLGMIKASRGDSPPSRHFQP